MSGIRRTVALMSFIVAATTWGGSPRAEEVRSPGATVTESEALVTAQRWAALLGEANVPALEALLNERYVHIHATALVESKTQFLDAFRNGSRRYDPIQLEETSARVFGGSAVVTGRFNLKAFSRGRTIEGVNRFSLVVVSTPSGREVASFQATPIPPPPKISTAANAAPRKPDVPFDPTPPAVVDAMLELAAVRPGDVVYDLGCGDGRIVVRAAQLGARAVGIDIDPARIEDSRARARAEHVEDRTTFLQGDLFEAKFGDATVVTLFLWPGVNLRLRPRLLDELRPGTRVVSYMHDMGDWKPQRTIKVDRGHSVYLWIIPERRGSPAR